VLFCGASSALADDGGDWFDPFVNFNAGIIEGIDGVVGSAGLAIVLYTLLVKVVTFPVNQISSRTNAVFQALQPQMQEIQKRYEREEITEEMSGKLLNQLYSEYSIFPLSGLLLPLIVQLPVFVALFRAIGKLAAQDVHFREGFLWIPSLAGPSEFGKPTLDWLLKTRTPEQFEPLIGWQDAGFFCLTPVLLIVVQLLSMRIVPAPGNQGWTTYLFSLFIGISSLVSPQAVSVYWLVNTACTGGQQLLVRGQIEEEFPGLMQAAEKAQEESGGIRYTRTSTLNPESQAETQASKDITARVKEMQPAAPRTRPARRKAAAASSKQRRKRR